jgi:hypothetical protein
VGENGTGSERWTSIFIPSRTFSNACSKQFVIVFLSSRLICNLATVLNYYVDNEPSSSSLLDKSLPSAVAAASASLNHEKDESSSSSSEDSEIEFLFSYAPPTRATTMPTRPLHDDGDIDCKPAAKEKSGKPQTIYLADDDDKSCCDFLLDRQTPARMKLIPTWSKAPARQERAASVRDINGRSAAHMTFSSVSLPWQKDSSFRDTENNCTDAGAGLSAVETTSANHCMSVAVELEPEVATATKYACVSSAYLQNLAEICYTILFDLRWRLSVGSPSSGANSTALLFRWEWGDDMSIVTQLSRYFRPKPIHRRESTTRCICAVCSDTQATPSGNRSGDESQEDGDSRPVVSDSIGQNAVDLNGVDDVDNGIDDGASRSLYLYCRLFYRKGPWFRIDSIYKSYYAPVTRAESTLGPEGMHETEEGMAAIGLTAYEFNSTRKSSPATETIIDKALLESHKACLTRLLVDLCQLKSAGSIRSFIDEEECGKTVGLSVLTADERKIVLSKLGGKNKFARRKDGNVTSASDKNEIWKQMSQQHSISSLFGKGKQSHKCLPVLKHVNELLVEKLAYLVVQMCFPTQYVQANLTRTYCNEVQAHLRVTLTRIIPDGTYIGTCFRLREAPMRSLQRMCRLYLCATSGPGLMRGDGSNGWRSLNDVDNSQINPPMKKVIPPPTASTWNKLEYPGLLVRFGLTPALFSRAFESIAAAKTPVQECSDNNDVHVFYSKQSFRAWEMGVELRANVDYLVELREKLRSEQLRQGKGALLVKTSGNSGSGSVDFLRILEPDGQEAVLSTFYDAIEADALCRRMDHIDLKLNMDECRKSLNSDCEKVLGCIGALLHHVLCLRHNTVSNKELELIVRRPWLRHLMWDGCLAYILWDIIPYYEKNGMFRLAVQSLQVLLFGKIEHQLDEPTVIESTALAPLLLSRRARGKVLDRLVIDSSHLHRAVHREDKTSPKVKTKILTERTDTFCKHFIATAATYGSISFSAIRGLARRLKQPLRQTLAGLCCTESRELGLRFDNGQHMPPAALTEAKSKYSDWKPPTDRTVANAIATDKVNDAGRRCAFVGFEEGDLTVANPYSLNVEELAMEYYRTGRLPNEESSSAKGGWHGWHDEGGHLRALFRVLSSAKILGMDWGCAYDAWDKEATEARRTIHLSPYQAAPFDLHVGYELHCGSDGQQSIESGLPNNSFYFRRRSKIDMFLSSLERMSSQELCDLVFQSISDRLKWTLSHRDPTMERDLVQTRSLSAVAAGCGGKLLAAAFRCMFYDYRHYSGGLPDLLLFRALYDDITCGENDSHPFVSLGEWIGESFSPEHQKKAALERGLSILSDRDDEFLGCSKVGDSGGSMRSYVRQRIKEPPPLESTQTATPFVMPERLLLTHKGRRVKVECMMVEVKSSNDRLDARQEDWLNVLDRHGNARVCKFEASDKLGKQALSPNDVIVSKDQEPKSD